MQVDCPNCGVHLRSARPLEAGARVRCPKCGGQFLAAEVGGSLVLVEVAAPPPDVVVATLISDEPPRRTAPPRAPAFPAERPARPPRGAPARAERPLPRPRRSRRQDRQVVVTALVIGAGALVVIAGCVAAILLAGEANDRPPPQAVAQAATPSATPSAPAAGAPALARPAPQPMGFRPEEEEPAPGESAYASPDPRPRDPAEPKEYAYPGPRPRDAFPPSGGAAPFAGGGEPPRPGGPFAGGRGGEQPWAPFPPGGLDEPGPGGGPFRPPLAGGRGIPRLVWPVDVRTAHGGAVIFPNLFPASDAGKSPATPGRELTLEEIKKATVYVKVESGPVRASGSGFLIRAEGGTGYIATNHHVIDPGADEDDPRKRMTLRALDWTVSVVFDSGLPTERLARAEVIGMDPIRDLAVLRVTGVPDLPAPIDPDGVPEYTETTPVLICGFPFGEDLATGTRHPAITINKGSVSSVRRDDEGEVALVQIDGNLNPGNSGGPVVDEKGRLVGISVATIVGSGIGLAIPGAELKRLFDGRVMEPILVLLAAEGTNARLKLILPVADPRKVLRGLRVDYGRAKSTKSLPGKGPDGRWGALEKSVKVNLEREEFGASGDLVVPTQGVLTVLQISYIGPDGQRVYARPLAYQIDLGGPGGGFGPDPGRPGFPGGGGAFPPGPGRPGFGPGGGIPPFGPMAPGGPAGLAPGVAAVP